MTRGVFVAQILGDHRQSAPAMSTPRVVWVKVRARLE